MTRSTGICKLSFRIKITFRRVKDKLVQPFLIREAQNGKRFYSKSYNSSAPRVYMNNE